MESKKHFNNNFVLYTSILSGILSILYVWKGFESSFTFWTYIVIGMNLLYIPLAFIFKKKAFAPYYLIYAIILLAVIAFTKTYLYNNFSALFIVCIVVMINPKICNVAFIMYFVAVCVVFAFNEENLCHFLIHICRSVWFILIVMYVTDSKFDRKKLILYEDEKKILDQLLDGKMYQKEVVGFSENTVYRKLKAARERNGGVTREELIELYKQEKDYTDTQN